MEASIKAGKLDSEIWANPAKAAQKDTDARWIVKYNKAKIKEGRRKLNDLAIPEFGYKDHISIDNHFGFIRIMDSHTRLKSRWGATGELDRLKKHRCRGLCGKNLPVCQE